MDSAMPSLYQVIEHANPIWQQAVYNLSWSHGLVASAYGVAAWFCFLNVQTEDDVQESCALWCTATVLMCLLGVNVVLQADVFVIQMCRALAKLQGWYGQRRELQYFVIGFIALIAFGLGRLIFQQPKHFTDTFPSSVSTGILALLLLLAVRVVSAHGTDAVINTRIAGLSMGRLFELVGISLVMCGALHSLYPGVSQLHTRSMRR
jgi:hypothetical protein